MTQIRKSDHGIVVEDLGTGMQYAISDSNYSVKKHRKVRELGPGESVLTYQPRRREPLGSLGAETSGAGSPGAAGDQETDSGDSL